MTDAFDFVDGDRTFSCLAESRSASATEKWWWFRVSSERHQRYAPFRASAGDTHRNVQSRIIAYYDDLLARRAMPATSYYRRNAPAAAAAPAAPVAAAPAD